MRLLAAGIVWAGGGTAAFGLTPEQVAVVVNGGSEGSKEVARHYMAARQIPAGNLVSVTVPAAGWSDKAYVDRVVKPIRTALTERKLAEKIKCLVLTYDMPLTVPGTVPNEAEKADIEGYRKKVAEASRALEGAIAEFERMGVAGATSAATSSATGAATGTGPATRATAPSADLAALENKAGAASQAAAERITKLPADRRAAAVGAFMALHQRIFGAAGVLAITSVNAESPGGKELKARLDAMGVEVREAEARTAELAKGRSTPASRREMFNLRTKTHGVVGGANQAGQIINELSHLESSACLDSELMLLWEDNYPRARWMANPYSLDVYPQVAGRAGLPRVMMVSRVDGLTPAATMEMINTGLKVEKAGLEGVCYIDARGIQSPGYKPFDLDMQSAAEYLRQNSTMKVVVDKEETLLKVENCPDAALYCGWYSLHKYVDSCQWKPGAVGYHVASFEMGSLHEEKEKGWVSNLLRRGFCGTLGATEEPYLPSFPRPSHFFPLLMSGEFTQGEVYFVTCPWLSWRTGYVGDPLYNPFKAKPALAVEKVKENAELKRAYGVLEAMGVRGK